MKAKVITLDNNEVENIDISQHVFGVEAKESILNLVVKWQRAKKQAGTHQTKSRSDVQGTTKKPHSQKGTGKARLGSLRATQCRGGGIIFGPLTRDHSFDLPKKIRKLGLRMALSAKYAEGKLGVVENLKLDSVSTKDLSLRLANLYSKSLLVIHTNDADCENFIKSSSNIINVNVLPQIGANVFDLLKHDNVLITKEAVRVLEDRLK